MPKLVKDKSVKISNWHKQLVANAAKERRQPEKAILEIAIEKLLNVQPYMPQIQTK